MKSSKAWDGTATCLDLELLEWCQKCVPCWKLHVSSSYCENFLSWWIPSLPISRRDSTVTQLWEYVFCWQWKWLKPRETASEIRIYIWGSQCQFSLVQSLSYVQLFVTPSTTAWQPSLSITNSQSLLKLMSIELVMPSNNLILLLLPSISPSIGVFSNESALSIRWPKYRSFGFSISPSNEYSGLISFRIDRFDPLQSKGLSRIFSSTTILKHQFLAIENPNMSEQDGSSATTRTHF